MYLFFSSLFCCYLKKRRTVWTHFFLNRIFSALTTRRTKGDMWHTTSGWASHFSFRWDSSPNPLWSFQISLYSTNPTLALILQDSVHNTAQSFNKQGGVPICYFEKDYYFTPHFIIISMKLRDVTLSNLRWPTDWPGHCNNNSKVYLVHNQQLLQQREKMPPHRLHNLMPENYEMVCRVLKIS